MGEIDHGRRRFLTGVSAGMAGTILVPAARSLGQEAGTPAGTEDAAKGDPDLLGPGKRLITLHVNGTDRRVKVAPRDTLLDALRGELGLTGAKRVCDRGECGACTVLLDGEAVYSCLTLAVLARGRRIATIESLRDGERLHPIQQAFLEKDAQQCGFCTPGQILAAKALLDRHPAPTPGQIRTGMCGNLCRCGASTKILQAVELAARRMG